jgi:choline dehydrogenase-like flavoprotein
MAPNCPTTTNEKPMKTDFSRDVLGRYVCNGLDEALCSTDPTAMRPDGRPQAEARPFDTVVIGGGTFGAVVAEHMAFRDRARRHRVLVLDGGPLVLDEHVQNLPVLDLNLPSAATIPGLINNNEFGLDKPRFEVWGLPWHATVGFVGLAYCLGGRSVYFGGWSPEPLASELPATWPAAVVADLTVGTLPNAAARHLPPGTHGYFRQAAAQIGTAESNDFIFGDLHRVLREQLFTGIGTVTDAVPLANLPDHPAIRYAAAAPTSDQLRALLGLPAGAAVPSPAAAKNRLKLEAPLAVQGRSGHAGFFPFQKFSTVPLLIKAAREAYRESGGDDARKRLMIVPNCHVTRLITAQDGQQWRVTEVETTQGRIPIPQGGTVVIALGTIESARLAKDSLRDLPAAAWDRIGTNLIAHLRSNLDIRVRRESLTKLPAAAAALQAAALFVKGRHSFADGTLGHFHLQITASGLGALGNNSEAELFKLIPDIDTYEAHGNANDSHVVITIRGIGEMQPHNPDNRIWLASAAAGLGAQLPPETISDEFGVERAFVSVAITDPNNPAPAGANAQTVKDGELWDAMDAAAKDVAKVFGVPQPPRPRRDGLGTTHHEAGTLFVGEVTSDSVTLPDARLRHTTNAYVAGPALFPTGGSPNPMLTGVALARRLGDLLGASPPDQPDPGFTMLFDGANTANWRMTTIRNQPPERSNPGSMRVIDGALETVAGNDIGVYWCTVPMPPDFVLRLQWLRWSQDANSGVYLRFPDPEIKGASIGYNNTAFVPDDFGFEVQIDELGHPDGQPIHRTGAIYRKDGRTDNEVLTQKPARDVGDWNDYEIRVEGQTYTVKLNGEQVCLFDNTGLYPGRGLASTTAAPSFIGLQVYANPRYFVRFRRVQIRAI